MPRRLKIKRHHSPKATLFFYPPVVHGDARQDATLRVFALKPFRSRLAKQVELLNFYDFRNSRPSDWFSSFDDQALRIHASDLAFSHSAIPTTERHKKGKGRNSYRYEALSQICAFQMQTKENSGENEERPGNIHPVSEVISHPPT